MTTFNVGDMVIVDNPETDKINGDIGVIKAGRGDSLLGGYYTVEFGKNSKLYRTYGLRSLYVYPKNLKPYYVEIQYDASQQGDRSEDI